MPPDSSPPRPVQVFLDTRRFIEMASLFTEGHGFALVGAGRIGEMVFQATPAALERLDQLIGERAEETPRAVRNDETGETELRVSGYRSEVGALAEVNLHDGVDRVPFSAAASETSLKVTTRASLSRRPKCVVLFKASPRRCVGVTIRRDS
jgi:hypothetical protein